MSETEGPKAKTFLKQFAVGAIGVTLLPLREIARCAFPENKKLEKIAAVADMVLNLSILALPLLSVDFQIPVATKLAAVVASTFAIAGQKSKNSPSA